MAEDVYGGVVERLEPDLTGVDKDPVFASIAISLKRIADVLETKNDWGEQGADILARAIKFGITDGLQGR